MRIATGIHPSIHMCVLSTSIVPKDVPEKRILCTHHMN